MYTEYLRVEFISETIINGVSIAITDSKPCTSIMLKQLSYVCVLLERYQRIITICMFVITGVSWLIDGPSSAVVEGEHA